MVLFLAMAFFIVVFFYAEMVNAKKLNIPLLSTLHNKYMLLLLASTVLFIVSFICEKMPWEDGFSMLLAIVVSGLFASYFLSVYILFRGLLLVFKISGKGEEHPTCQRIRKIIQHPFLTLAILFLMVLFVSMGSIYGLWVYWQIQHS
jgi:hypothetical protein